MIKYIVILVVIIAGGYSAYQYFEQQKIQEQQRLHKQVLLKKQQQEAAFKKAFDAWYVPPKGCAEDKSGPLRVTCINDRIHNKREFKKTWPASAH